MITTARFAMRVVNMRDLGEWDDTPDDERALVFYDALYAIMHAEVHGNFKPMEAWITDHEALGYDTDNDKLMKGSK